MSTATAARSNRALYLDNPQVAGLPNHLRQFAVDQRYEDYTPIDHAVWRYIMRQAVHILKVHAHRIYFQGLINTGINLDAIPRIEEMNQILGRIGWGAVAVDGFIPPAAFMEFQAFRVLVIACDMRQIHHIEYTPAPDIVHEAAGHAPIIVDAEYAAYLQTFGEVGTRAMYSKRDFELYQAIRHLSILKERPDADPREIRTAEAEVLHLQQTLGRPSEMARLSRLHWWTVEYGLIGPMEMPKIYGAGLLSSIGEAVACLEPHVKKIPYTIDAANYAFDITTMQPQLFVTPDFRHLNNVLGSFVAEMAFSTGGTAGLAKAIECENVCTVQYSSGLQVTGVFTSTPDNGQGQPAYVQAKGPCALAVDFQQIEGHGKSYHAEGFGSPVGKLAGVAKPLDAMTEGDLAAQGIVTGRTAMLKFESGVMVTGRVKRFTLHEGRLLVISFEDCRVTLGERLLFDPAWGVYDMAVGEKIVSVFNGAADKDAYEEVALVPRERTIKVQAGPDGKGLEELYQQIRQVRDQQRPYDELRSLWCTLQSQYPGDWLAGLEILEICVTTNLYPDLRLEIKQNLDRKAATQKELSKLIHDGLFLIFKV